MNLTDREKEQIKGMIDRGEPLPPKYKSVLFAQPNEVELIWPGKTNEVTNVVLPFQSIEQIDEPREGTPDGNEQKDFFEIDGSTGRQTGGWTNKLIWGDNKLVLSSLKNGPLRKQIEDAGGLKLVYIDPPFDVGADFSFEIEIGEEERVMKEPSIIEDIAYRDTWGRGAESYLTMINERLILIRDILAEDGSIYVHCDWRLNSLVRLVLDEIFGSDQFRAEVKWKRVVSTGSSKAISRRFPVVDDSIFFYVRTDKYRWNVQYTPLTEEYKARFTQRDNLGLFYWDNLATYSDETLKRLIDSNRIKLPIEPGRNPRYKNYLHERRGAVAHNIWDDITPLNSQAIESANYPTQKPSALLERIISASSNPGDLVADFFCGSGTTLAVAEKLGRKWIGCDLGRFAIHTSRKRLIGVQRELKAAGKPYRSFEILNLGKYERQYFVGIDPTLPEDQRRTLSIQKEENYLGLILNAYKAERVFQSPPFHGKKGGAFVVVGPIDAPVTQSQVHEAVEACRKHKVSRLDVLGFEFEMGLTPLAIEEARSKGVALALRNIPKDVFDKRAVEKGQVVFYDVAYVEVKPVLKEGVLTVKLTDFGVFYRQEDAEAILAELKNGASKVVVDNGQVVKIVKDKSGVVTREVLTKTWSDWIDYWAVDYDFQNRKEIIRVTEDGKERDVWTGGYIFENEWQSYRTRKDRKLELSSAPHIYKKKGKHKIAVKVIDIFGNDTTKVIEVKI